MSKCSFKYFLRHAIVTQPTYMCEFKLLRSPSPPIETLAAVVVNPADGSAILHESFTLHCEVTGNVSNIQWWRNDQLISTDNTTVFKNGNKTLILNPVQHSDNGAYQCQVFNGSSNITSSIYKVEINCK